LIVESYHISPLFQEIDRLEHSKKELTPDQSLDLKRCIALILDKELNETSILRVVQCLRLHKHVVGVIPVSHIITEFKSICGGLMQKGEPKNT